MTLKKLGVKAICDGVGCERETVGLTGNDVVKQGWRVVPQPGGNDPHSYCSFRCELTWIERRLGEPPSLFDEAEAEEGDELSGLLDGENGENDGPIEAGAAPERRALVAPGGRGAE